MKITCRFMDANIDKEIAGKILKDCNIKAKNIKFINCYSVGHCTISNRENNKDLNICFTRIMKTKWKKALEKLKELGTNKIEKIGETTPTTKEILIKVNGCYENNVPISKILMHELLHLKTLTHCDNQYCLFFDTLNLNDTTLTFCEKHQNMYNKLLENINHD